MAVIGKIVSGDHFDWINGHAVAEVSELQGTFNDMTGPLYDDACDVGFVMKSHRTGMTKQFYLNDIHMDNEGEILFWEFLSSEVRGDVSHISLKVFND